MRIMAPIKGRTVAILNITNEDRGIRVMCYENYIKT